MKSKGVFVETAMKYVTSMLLGSTTKDALVVCEAFIDRMSGKRESVLIQLREGARQSIQSNRKKLRSIIETIVLCGRQNIAL